MKSIKTKVASIALIATMLFGSSMVFADQKSLEADQYYLFGDTFTVASSQVYVYDDDEFPEEKRYFEADPTNTTFEFVLDEFLYNRGQWVISLLGNGEECCYLFFGYDDPEVTEDRVPIGIIFTGGDGSEEAPFSFDLIYEIPESEPAQSSSNDTTSSLSPEQIRLMSVQNFVENLYINALDRTYDVEGRDYWVDKIFNGSTGTDIVKGFLGSQEFIGKNSDNEEFVTILYSVFLERTPSAAEVANWSNALDNGATRAQVIQGFADSPEWASRCAYYDINV